MLPGLVGVHCPRDAVALGLSAVQCLNVVGAYFNEVKGPTAYSKFGAAPVKTEEAPTQQVMIPSRQGMVLIYSPALAAAVWAFVHAPSVNGREGLVAAMLFAHFGKRVAETVLVHRYSGTVALAVSAFIGVYYVLITALIVWQQARVPAVFYAAQPAAIPAVGLALFAVGLAGNLYHHVLLAQQRTSASNKKDYVIPTGGLFDLVTAPHYLFEIIDWLGLALVAQQLNALLVALGMASYLAGRSVATTAWYAQKFGDAWPRDRKNIVPFLF